MTRIHMVGGEKGGVGKSVLARVLAQYHIDRITDFEALFSQKISRESAKNTKIEG